MKCTKIVVALAVMLLASTAFAASTADIIILVDESGSMSGEHAWISGMVSSLETALVAGGVEDNRYGVVGFGNINHDTAGGNSQDPHTHLLDGAAWGVASDITAKMTPGFDLYGGYEDGWDAIEFALANYGFRSDAAVNLILITDEDREAKWATATTNAQMETLLAKYGALLNVVVNNPFYGTAGATGALASALGVDSDLNAYYADGSGGFTSSLGDGVVGNGYLDTETEYVALALANGGAAWDLNKLRAGGLTADSFTAAFVDIKVGEIQDQGVPEPGTFVLLGGALSLMLVVRRRRKA